MFYISIKLRGFKGLPYLKYQEARLKQFLNKNVGMKVLIQVDIKIITEADKRDDEGNHVREVIKFRSRRFEVLNTDDITDVISKMAKDIQTQFEEYHLIQI